MVRVLEFFFSEAGTSMYSVPRGSILRQFLFFNYSKMFRKVFRSRSEFKTTLILLSKAKDFYKINTTLPSHFIKKHEIIEYLGYQLVYKLRVEAMASKVLAKISYK